MQSIVEGLTRTGAPTDLYLIKIDSWFGDRWLGFSNKVMGGFGVQHRRTLRVPPFVPARVVSERFYRRAAGGNYVEEPSPKLHIVQTSENNEHRLMSRICPNAAAVWWTGSTRANRRGSLMAYLPTSEGHTGWYAELKKLEGWEVAQTLLTTKRELAVYAASA